MLLPRGSKAPPRDTIPVDGSAGKWRENWIASSGSGIRHVPPALHIQRPRAPQLLHGAVVHADIDIGRRAGNRKIRRSRLRPRPQFARKLPECIASLGAGRKIADRVHVPGVPEARTRKDMTAAGRAQNRQQCLVVGVDQRVAPGLLLNPLQEALRLRDVHGFAAGDIFQVQREDLAARIAHDLQVELGLFHRIAGGAEMVGTPQVTAGLRRVSLRHIRAIGNQAMRGAMDHTCHARRRGKLAPVDCVLLILVDHERGTRVAPGGVEGVDHRVRRPRRAGRQERGRQQQPEEPPHGTSVLGGLAWCRRLCVWP